MHPTVRRALAKWPDVPDVYGWLLLDRRGQWRLRDPWTDTFERIGNAALREYIGRHYAPDAAGRWCFQNGPQSVFVKLAYAPLVVRSEGDALIDQCGRPFAVTERWLDEEGSLLFSGPDGVALLHDHDLASYAERFGTMFDRAGRLHKADIPRRFGFDPDPAPSSDARGSKHASPILEEVDALRQKSL